MDRPTPRYLTKSRFKLGMECPAKLFYTGKDQGPQAVYANAKLEDSFLKTLAEGGFQVGALAQKYFPGGVEVDTLNPEDALKQTSDLLQQENAIIFEAAIHHAGLFIRVDILVKQGTRLELIEVKAKSFDPGKETFRGDRGGITAEWLPYLLDIAFQKHVVTQAFPGCTVNAFLMLADKSAACPTDGLHQKFRVTTLTAGGKARPRVVAGDLTPEELAQRILHQAPVDRECEDIYRQPLKVTRGPQDFVGRVRWLQEHYAADRKIPCPPSTACAECQFKATAEEKAGGLRSGFEECWKAELHWHDADFARPTVLSLWNSKRKPRFLGQGKYHLADLTEEDIGPEPDGKPGLSPQQRQWLQVEKARANDRTVYIDRAGLRREMDTWKFPLHFIDFETTRVAIPFHRGRHPYELVAFQFSHHVVREDGRVEHAGQYLNTRAGCFPNFEFLRELAKELSQDEGSIFCYSNFENSTLNQIDAQLDGADLAAEERTALRRFIRSITTSTKDSTEQWIGPRSMVDLRDLVLRYYYAPETQGSNSIKQVLPAVLNTSTCLRRKYAQPIYGRGCDIPSLNMDPIAWIHEEADGRVKDPYRLLPPLFDESIRRDVERLLNEEELRDGGAAMVAYARMQFEEMSQGERDAIQAGLLRYCELDTLAMVMLYEAWREEAR
jgi:hypothetical protein